MRTPGLEEASVSTLVPVLRLGVRLVVAARVVLRTGSARLVVVVRLVLSALLGVAGLLLLSVVLARRRLRPELPTIGSSSKMPKRLLGLKRWLLCGVVRVVVGRWTLGFMVLRVVLMRLEP